MTHVESDVDRRVTEEYGADGAAPARRALASLTAVGSVADVRRIQLACLRLACGDIDRLVHFVGVAQRDPRDVIAWAEYPGVMDGTTTSNRPPRGGDAPR